MRANTEPTKAKIAQSRFAPNRIYDGKKLSKLNIKYIGSLVANPMALNFIVNNRARKIQSAYR